MTHMDDMDDFDELVADARALLDAQLDAGRPPPDVLDVLQRARELGVTPDDETEQVFVVDAMPELERALEPDLELAELNADARLLLDGLLERRGAVKRTRWRRQPRAVAVAAAAVVMLGLVGAAFASKWQELESAAKSDHFAAAAIAELDRAWQAESERALSPAFWVPAWTIPVTSARAGPTSPQSPTVEPDVASVPTDATAKPDTATRLADTATRLAELDAQAYALLRAGQHEQAAQRFRTIVKIGGRSEYAELAFGELFALARRDSLSDELNDLWSAYLKRFPRGRYADAARAGLCRRAPEPNKATCWTDYLLEHPRGAARSEALRESQDD
jgi:hypothetical protein